MSRGQFARAVEAGRWRRLARGIYALDETSEPPLQRAMAAHLSRPESAVSHLTALRALGADTMAPPKPHLSVPPNTSGSSPLAVIHRVLVPPHHTVRRHGMRVTDGARTLVDLVRVLPPVRFRSVLDTAMHLGLASTARIDQVALEVGLPQVAHRRLLADLDVWRHTIRPGSPGEARLLRCLDQWGLAPPERQVRIVDDDGTVIARIDGGWTDVRVGFEYDSIEWHGPARWEHDEARHARLARLGWKIFHIEAHDLRPGEHLLRDALLAAHATATATSGRSEPSDVPEPAWWT